MLPLAALRALVVLATVLVSFDALAMCRLQPQRQWANPDGIPVFLNTHLEGTSRKLSERAVDGTGSEREGSPLGDARLDQLPQQGRR